MKLHVLADSRFQVYATVSGPALALERDPLVLVGAAVRDLAEQMASHIVKKRIQSDRDVRTNSITYHMDLYAVTPEELAALVEERAQRLLAAPGAHFVRTQDHIQ